MLDFVVNFLLPLILACIGCCDIVCAAAYIGRSKRSASYLLILIIFIFCTGHTAAAAIAARNSDSLLTVTCSVDLKCDITSHYCDTIMWECVSCAPLCSYTDQESVDQCQKRCAGYIVKRALENQTIIPPTQVTCADTAIISTPTAADALQCNTGVGIYVALAVVVFLLVAAVVAIVVLIYMNTKLSKRNCRKPTPATEQDQGPATELTALTDPVTDNGGQQRGREGEGHTDINVSNRFFLISPTDDSQQEASLIAESGIDTAGSSLRSSISTRPEQQ